MPPLFCHDKGEADGDPIKNIRLFIGKRHWKLS